MGERLVEYKSGNEQAEELETGLWTNLMTEETFTHVGQSNEKFHLLFLLFMST